MIREELRGRAEVVRQVVRYFKAGSMGGLGEGQGEQGCGGCGRLLDRGPREGSEEQSVQDLEPDVFGELLPALGARGGDTEIAWRRHQDSWGAHGRGSGRPDGGSAEAGGGGRTDLP